MTLEKIKISMFTIKTYSGKSKDWEQFLELSKSNIKTLNEIGYGSNKKYTMTEYLNSINPKFKYLVKQIKYDSGDFSEKFEVCKAEVI